MISKKQHIDEKLGQLAQNVRKRNEKQMLEDASDFRIDAFERRKYDDPSSMSKDFRHVADIPGSIFFKLPQDVQNDPKALNAWLKKYGKEFILVKDL
jgi:hypothetical protein